MPKITRPIRYLLKKISNPFRRAKIWVKHRLGWLGVPVIVPFNGYCSSDDAFVLGMVVEDKSIAKPKKNQKFWTNVMSMLKRYVGDEMPGISIVTSFGNSFHKVETNENGIFHTKFPNKNPSIKRWQEVVFELETFHNREGRKIHAKGAVMSFPENAAYGVISDIDDTILISHATRVLKKLRLMLINNAYTRKPFKGAAAFYRALNQRELNPFFYVSSSEWNLYDLLSDFCEYNGFPKGVFLLKELKNNIFKFWKSGGGDHNHKFHKINHILNIYSQLEFILIGDSGQRDPEIYYNIIKSHPKRIKVVYIRHPKKKKISSNHVTISKLTQAAGVEIVFVNDSFEAARDALKRGFIKKETLKSIAQEVYAESKMPDDLEQIGKKFGSNL